MASVGLLVALCVFALQVIGTFQQQSFECTVPADIIFVIDGSDALRFENQRRAVSSRLDVLDLRLGMVHVGATLVSGTRNQTLGFSGDKNDILLRLNSFQYTAGIPNLELGFQVARDIISSGGRPNVLSVVVVISNARQSNLAGALNQAAALRNGNVQIMAITEDLNNPAHLNELRQMTGTWLNVFTASTSANFATVLQLVLRQACSLSVPPVTQTTQPPTQPTVPPTFSTMPPTVTTTIPPTVTTMPPTGTPPTTRCDYGTTDVYMVAEVSARAEVQSRQSAANDFGQLKTGLSRLVNTIQARRDASSNPRVGLVYYSDNAIHFDLGPVQNIVAAIPNIASGVSPGGSNLLAGLTQISRAPRKGDYPGYVIVVVPSDSVANGVASLPMQEAQRIKNLGYTLVMVVVYSTTNNVRTLGLETFASGANYVIPVKGYAGLAQALAKFNEDNLCTGPPPERLPGLCTNSGAEITGTAYVAHPNDCQLYLQCYYNLEMDNGLEPGVVRQCPNGLFWDDAAKKCDLPKKAGCPIDKCQDMCETYAMRDNCRGYFACENGTSVPKCCPCDHAFEKGKGCVKDTKGYCKDTCKVPTNCKYPACQRRSVPKHPGSYHYTFPGSSVWFTQPCKDGFIFDTLTCKCSAPIDHKCDPYLSVDFRSSTQIQQLRSDSNMGINVTGGTYDKSGILLGAQDSFHIDTMSKRTNEPITIRFRYREAPSSLKPDQATIMMYSSTKCPAKGDGSAQIYVTSEMIGVSFGIGHRRDTIEVPTKGFSEAEFKRVTITYDRENLAVAVKGTYHHVTQIVKASKDYSFPCGFDFGASENYDGFRGTFQWISVFSCAMAKYH